MVLTSFALCSIRLVDQLLGLRCKEVLMTMKEMRCLEKQADTTSIPRDTTSMNVEDKTVVTQSKQKL